jgi:glycine/D-amino acid oxidase-like deaminating enzyme
MKTIAVIGGGITGVTTAYALAKRDGNIICQRRAIVSVKR